MASGVIYVAYSLGSVLYLLGLYLLTFGGQYKRSFFLLGFLSMLAGMIILGIGIIYSDSQKISPKPGEYSCPQCRRNITYQSSPLNCSFCGLRIDWSGISETSW